MAEGYKLTYRFAIELISSLRSLDQFVDFINLTTELILNSRSKLINLISNINLNVS